MSQTLDVDTIRRQHALGYGACHVDELIAEVERLRDEIMDARQACPSVRMQDHFHKPLLELINLEVSRGFNRDSEVRRLGAEVERLRAAQGSEKHTAQCVEIALLLGHAGFPEDIPIQEAVRQLIQRVRAPQGEQDGVSLIAAERQRQVSVEGWTLEHDDSHSDGSLAAAASCLAAEGTDAEFSWPNYDVSWIKSLRDRHIASSRVRQLAIAGALVAAEIDRLQRTVPASAPLPAPTAKQLCEALLASRDYNEHAWNCGIGPMCKTCDELKFRMVQLRVAALDAPSTLNNPNCPPGLTAVRDSLAAPQGAPK